MLLILSFTFGLMYVIPKIKGFKRVVIQLSSGRCSPVISFYSLG